MTYDVIIIGGGPGGYVAAIRGRQLGLSVALVEKENLGGVCLNWGCIPTKSLLRNAEVISQLNEGDVFGFEFDRATLKIDYEAARKRSREVSGKLVKGLSFLMKKNKVEVYQGTARLKDSNSVEVVDLGETIKAKNIIIATGARSSLIPGIEKSSEKIMTSREALEMNKIPKSIVVVGAGAIGMEFSSIWRDYGAEVTIIEMMPSVLPLEDEEISLEAKNNLLKRGIKILTGARVDKVEEKEDRVDVTISYEGKSEVLTFDKMLISVGVKPNIEMLGLEKLAINMEYGYIKVDEAMRTNLPGIFAIGDVTGKLALAHVASAQGIIAVETIAGKETKPIKYENMPRCIYCKPEVASVGLTEKQAKEKGYSVKTGKFPFSANGKALGLGETAGFIKVITDEKYGEIIGVHMIGPHVTEMLAGPAGLISLEATYEELANIVHPHPTLSEAIMEAAHAVDNKAIHI